MKGQRGTEQKRNKNSATQDQAHSLSAEAEPNRRLFPTSACASFDVAMLFFFPWLLIMRFCAWFWGGWGTAAA